MMSCSVPEEKKEQEEGFYKCLPRPIACVVNGEDYVMQHHELDSMMVCCLFDMQKMTRLLIGMLWTVH